MFDIGWTELMLIGIVALIVIGPKDLPNMFRTVGNFVGKARRMARDFQRSMEDAADESGLSEATKGLGSLRGRDPLGLNAIKDSNKKYTDSILATRDAKIAERTAKDGDAPSSTSAKSEPLKSDAAPAKPAQSADPSKRAAAPKAKPAAKPKTAAKPKAAAAPKAAAVKPAPKTAAKPVAVKAAPKAAAKAAAAKAPAKPTPKPAAKPRKKPGATPAEES